MMKLEHILANVNDLNCGVVESQYDCMEHYVKSGYCIYLDKSILLHPALPNFLTHLFPMLVRYQRLAFVTGQTVKELERHALENQGDWDVFSHIVDVMNLILNYDLIEVLEEGGMYDAVLVTAKDSHVLLMTDDKELAGKIKEVCKIRSPKDKVISSMKIDEEGFLDLHTDADDDDKTPTELLAMDLLSASAIRKLIMHSRYNDIGKYVKMFLYVSRRLANMVLSICGERFCMEDIILIVIPNGEDSRDAGIVFTEKGICWWTDDGKTVGEIAYEAIADVKYDEETVCIKTSDAEEIRLFCGEGKEKQYSKHMYELLREIQELYQEIKRAKIRTDLILYKPKGFGDWLADKIDAFYEKLDQKKNALHARKKFQMRNGVSYADVRFDYKNVCYYQEDGIAILKEAPKIVGQYSDWHGGGWHGLGGPKDRDYKCLFWDVEEGEFVKWGQKLATVHRTSLLGYEDIWYMICIALCDGYVHLEYVPNRYTGLKHNMGLNIRRKTLIARVYETKEDYEKAVGKPFAKF